MLTILPTDTCYGLAGDLYSYEDFQMIHELKMRHEKKWLAFLVRDFDQLKQYTNITDSQIDFLQSYSYPWSVILQRREDFVLPEFLDSEKYSHISFRVASVCLPILQHSSTPALHYPLFLTSANLSGQPESTTLAQAQAYFPGIQGLDGGVCDRPPSDIFSIGEGGELQYVRRNYGS